MKFFSLWNKNQLFRTYPQRIHWKAIVRLLVLSKTLSVLERVRNIYPHYQPGLGRKCTIINICVDRMDPN